MSCWVILETEAKGKISTTDPVHIYAGYGTNSQSIGYTLLSSELAKIQIPRHYHQTFWFSNSGMGLRILHFTK